MTLIPLKAGVKVHVRDLIITLEYSITKIKLYIVCGYVAS